MLKGSWTGHLGGNDLPFLFSSRALLGNFNSDDSIMTWMNEKRYYFTLFKLLIVARSLGLISQYYRIIFTRNGAWLMTVRHTDVTRVAVVLYLCNNLSINDCPPLLIFGHGGGLQ